MARLPNAHHVIIDEAKLRDYALNPEHADGRHKARLFAAILGYTRENYAGLVEQIRRGVLEHDAVPRPSDDGDRSFQVDIPVTGPKGTAVVRTGWVVEENNDVTRLITLYPIRRRP